MALYQLPMIECSSCGQCIGHLFSDYYDLSKKLIDELQKRDVPTGDYTTSQGDDIGPYLRTYYEWYSKAKAEVAGEVLEYQPKNIVARALLRIKDLTDDMLPFGSLREPDGQLTPYEARTCCLRMFLGDPGATTL